MHWASALTVHDSMLHSCGSGARCHENRKSLTMIDDPILVHDWHAVAFSSQLNENAPTAARLLEHDLVVWRNQDGVHVWQDLCVHRGAKLSGGRVSNNCLACPYHGWQYDSGG